VIPFASFPQILNILPVYPLSVILLGMSETTPPTDHSEELLRKIQEYNSQLEQRIQEHVEELREEVLIRKRSEQALRESQRRFQTLVEKIPEVIFQLDIDLRVRYLNGAWSVITGVQSSEVLSEPFAGLFLEQTATELQRKLVDLVNGNTESVSLEGRYLRPDGTEIWLDIYADSERDTDGSINGVFGMAYNITRRKLAEDDMKRALVKEKELNRLRSQFISMTSHEFRTPLASILTSSELLEHYSERWPREKNLMHLKRIQSSVQHIVRLMDDVLILGKSDADRLVPEPVPLNVNQLVASLIDEHTMGHKATQHIAFTNDMECDSALLDPKLFRQIFGNIFSNALKYSPPDSTISVSLAGDCALLRLSVNDEGIGIPPADLAQLYEPFYRARNAGDVPGTGLGMSIVKRSVEAHGGTIHVSSSEGQGTRVHIILDLTRNHSQTPQTPAS